MCAGSPCVRAMGPSGMLPVPVGITRTHKGCSSTGPQLLFYYRAVGHGVDGKVGRMASDDQAFAVRWGPGGRAIPAQRASSHGCCLVTPRGASIGQDEPLAETGEYSAAPKFSRRLGKKGQGRRRTGSSDTNCSTHRDSDSDSKASRSRARARLSGFWTQRSHWSAFPTCEWHDTYLHTPCRTFAPSVRCAYCTRKSVESL